MCEELSNRPVLAIYDFRSKQEFIYRTNRVREITGASELIAGMYGEFVAMEIPPSSEPLGDAVHKARGGHIGTSSNGRLFVGTVPNLKEDEVGVVVYEGGGNLLVLYRNHAEYTNANRLFSRHVLERAYGLNMITASAPWPKGVGDEGFDEARSCAFRALDYVKRTGGSAVPVNVLPFTLVSRATYQPITTRVGRLDEARELTRETLCKESAFKRRIKRDDASGRRAVPWRMQGMFIDELGTETGKDSLIAVLYFDGNNIGARVKSVLEGVAPSKHVEAIRSFSKKLHAGLVENTVHAIDKRIGLTADDVQWLELHDKAEGQDAVTAGDLALNQKGYRVIIDHGDEITIVCNAHAAPLAVDAYFKAIEDSGYKACCGVAFCHAHDPFSEVYRIAEECCESGKRANRAAQRKAMADLSGQSAADASLAANASYVDFHFCRSGITGTLEQIRSEQEGPFTARPYRVDGSYERFLDVGAKLSQSKLQRSDMKALGRAILKGDSWYRLELERLKAKDPAAFSFGVAKEDGEALKRLLFDVSSVWDVFDVQFQAVAAQKR